MIQKDLSRDIKNRLKNISGQLLGIVKMLENDKDPEHILTQFKAAGNALKTAEFLLKDEVFRKSLAAKLSETMEACPGNCGEEDKIEKSRKEFPDLSLDQIADKMKEIEQVYEQMKKNLKNN